MAKRIAVVFETSWDRVQLEACRRGWEARYEVEYAPPSDAEAPWDFDVVAYILAESERLRGTLDGVFSTSDYPGATVAAAIAERLGLPGSSPRAVLRASHKYQSRISQREAVPEAVPGFSLVDPRDPTTWDPDVGFPCFVKPVKGAFSILSGRVESREELAAFLTAPRAEWFQSVFLQAFGQLVRHFELDEDGRWFVAEELLHGQQVTVEGWRSRHASGILGIVDSTFRPGTRSFTRFDYPSTLPADVQARMRDVTERTVAHLGLTDTLYNVELVWDAERDRIGIVEVNARACGQFADLYRKVDGVSGYEVALAVAAGDPPPEIVRGSGRHAAAASFPLRAFRPSRVVRAPDADRIRRVQTVHPDTLVWLECAAGDLLTDFDQLEDGESHRYAIVNLGGDDRADLDARLASIGSDLGLELEPL